MSADLQTPSAVTWIDRGHAIVARTLSAGKSEVVRIEREPATEAGFGAFLVQVVDRIGDRERVMIMGPDEMRLALEREYVSIFHRPERLVDVEPSGPIGTKQLLGRLRRLAA